MLGNIYLDCNQVTWGFYKWSKDLKHWGHAPFGERQNILPIFAYDSVRKKCLKNVLNWFQTTQNSRIWKK